MDAVANMPRISTKSYENFGQLCEALIENAMLFHTKHHCGFCYIPLNTVNICEERRLLLFTKIVEHLQHNYQLICPHSGLHMKINLNCSIYSHELSLIDLPKCGIHSQWILW